MDDDRDGAGGHEQPEGDGAGAARVDVDPTELPEPGTSRRRAWVGLGLVAVAAALLLGWFISGRGEDRDDVTTQSRDDRGEEALAPDAMWGRRWQLATILEGGKDRPIITDGESIVLDASTIGQLSFNGCNGGSGGADLDGDRLHVDEVMSTQMACVDAVGEALMAQDAWFGGFLADGPVVRVAPGRLTLSTSAATAVFTDLGPAPSTTTVPGSPDEPVSSDPGSGVSTAPVPDRSTTTTADGAGGGGGSSPGSPGVDHLWGQRWEITAVSTAAGSGVTMRTDGSAPSLSTLDEGRISFTGCNGGSGDARLVGDRLMVTAIAGTRMACSGGDGPALMAQDDALAAILQSGPTVSFEGDTLHLTSAAGSIEAIAQG